MTSSIAQPKNSQTLRFWALAAVALIAGGCAGPKVATDLLTQVESNETPLVVYAVAIDVEINPTINNDEQIDETVKESLQIALANANIFGADPAHSYKIHANVTVASQAAWSFGAFDGKLSIDYALFDESNKSIVEKTIYTEAGSDKMYFSGLKRHRRARAVNISKNVLQFVEVLQGQLKK